MDKQSHEYSFKEHEHKHEHDHEAESEGSDVERTLKTVGSAFVGTTDNMADVSIRCITCLVRSFTHTLMCVPVCMHTCLEGKDLSRLTI